jgi:DNA-binding NtrC family response regulator
MVLSDTIDVAELPEPIRSPVSFATAAASPSNLEAAVRAPESAPTASMLEDTERRLISDALAKTSGNQSEAARLLRIGRDALRYKMKKYGLAGSTSS